MLTGTTRSMNAAGIKRRFARTAAVAVAAMLAAACGTNSDHDAAGGSPSVGSPATTAVSTTGSPSSSGAATSATVAPTTTIPGRFARNAPVPFSFQPPGRFSGADAPGAFSYDDDTVQIVIAKPSWYADFTELSAVKPLAAPPTDVHKWLSAPGLPAVSEPEPFTIGGIATERFLQQPSDPTLAWEWAGPTLVHLPECRADGCLVLFGIGTDFWAADPRVPTWVIPIEVDGTQLLMGLSASPSAASMSAEEIWQRGKPILDTFAWG